MRGDEAQLGALSHPDFDHPLVAIQPTPQDALDNLLHKSQYILTGRNGGRREHGIPKTFESSRTTRDRQNC